MVAVNTGTGRIEWDTDLPTSPYGAAVAIDGDYVIAGAGAPLSPSQKSLIIAYKLGAHGHLPVTVGAQRPAS